MREFYMLVRFLDSIKLGNALFLVVLLTWFLENIGRLTMIVSQGLTPVWISIFKCSFSFFMSLVSCASFSALFFCSIYSSSINCLFSFTGTSFMFLKSLDILRARAVCFFTSSSCIYYWFASLFINYSLGMIKRVACCDEQTAVLSCTAIFLTFMYRSSIQRI